MTNEDSGAKQKAPTMEAFAGQPGHHDSEDDITLTTNEDTTGVEPLTARLREALAHLEGLTACFYEFAPDGPEPTLATLTERMDYAQQFLDSPAEAEAGRSPVERVGGGLYLEKFGDELQAHFEKFSIEDEQERAIAGVAFSAGWYALERAVERVAVPSPVDEARAKERAGLYAHLCDALGWDVPQPWPWTPASEDWDHTVRAVRLLAEMANERSAAGLDEAPRETCELCGHRVKQHGFSGVWGHCYETDCYCFRPEPTEAAAGRVVEEARREEGQ